MVNEIQLNRTSLGTGTRFTWSREIHYARKIRARDASYLAVALTMRGIKLEIGESRYRKSANRLAAVRPVKAGAEIAIPALEELFRLFLLLRNRFCSCERMCVQFCGFARTYVRTYAL